MITAREARQQSYEVFGRTKSIKEKKEREQEKKKRRIVERKIKRAIWSGDNECNFDFLSTTIIDWLKLHGYTIKVYRGPSPYYIVQW